MGEETPDWRGVSMQSSQNPFVPEDRKLPEDTSAYVDMMLALIDSVESVRFDTDPLLEIIFEVIDDMFAGRNTVQEAARIIQNRAARYVSEQS